MNSGQQGSLKKQNRAVAVLSVLLLAVVAFLYTGPDVWKLGVEKGTLPFINALINGLTTLLLIWAFVAIKNGQTQKHKTLMLAAVICSVVFLVLYVLQHASFDSTSYPDEVAGKGIYLFVLLTHIVLAAVIVPLVLLTLVRALSERFDKHRKIAKVTLPLWLYVSITGVIVYLMISPFY